MIALYDDGSSSFTLPAIPSVLIPLDTSGCKKVPPVTPTGQATTASTTQKSGKLGLLPLLDHSHVHILLHIGEHIVMCVCVSVCGW